MKELEDLLQEQGLKDTLYADLDAIIGEDEENLTEFEAYKLAVKLHESNKDIDTRNRLRAEQRKALRVYMYGEASPSLRQAESSDDSKLRKGK